MNQPGNETQLMNENIYCSNSEPDLNAKTQLRNNFVEEVSNSVS